MLKKFSINDIKFLLKKIIRYTEIYAIIENLIRISKSQNISNQIFQSISSVKSIPVSPDNPESLHTCSHCSIISPLLSALSPT